MVQSRLICPSPLESPLSLRVGGGGGGGLDSRWMDWPESRDPPLLLLPLLLEPEPES